MTTKNKQLKNMNLKQFKVIKDLRVLNPLSKKYGLLIDSEFKYVLNDVSLKTKRDLKVLGYEVKYFSGCFYPYVVKSIYYD